MPFLQSLFTCNNTDNNEKTFKREMDRLVTRMELIERDFANIDRFATRIDMKLSLLESKIDNLIIIMTR